MNMKVAGRITHAVYEPVGARRRSPPRYATPTIRHQFPSPCSVRAEPGLPSRVNIRSAACAMRKVKDDSNLLKASTER